MANNNKPVHEVRIGSVRAAVWLNEGKNGPWHNVTITRTYQDSDEIPDDEDINSTTSLDRNANDVPNECECRGDFDGDALTTLADVGALQRALSGP